MTSPTRIDRAVVSNASTRALLATLARRGADPARVLRACGLSTAAIGGEPSFMPLVEMVAVWDEAERVTRDWSLSLQAASRVPPGAYGTLDFVGITSPTVLESFQYAARYVRAVHGAAMLSVDRSPRSVAVEFDTPKLGALHEHRSSEFTFAVLLRRSWAATGVRWHPTEVRLVGPKPKDLEPFHRVFGSRIRFGQQMNRLILSSEMSRLPHRQRDDALCAHLCTFIEASVGRRVGGSTVAERCMAVLRTSSLAEGDVATVARRLGMSARSLQRTLMAGGVTFRGLRDAVWLNRARMLFSEGHSASEVSAALGFSEPSAFHRALRRWEGTPAWKGQDVRKGGNSP